MTKKQFLKSTIKNFSQVYFGKDNCCRCGCAGNYIYTTSNIHMQTIIDKNLPININDKLAKRRLNQAKKLISQQSAKIEIGDIYVNVIFGDNRALTFYFDEI